MNMYEMWEIQEKGRTDKSKIQAEVKTPAMPTVDAKAPYKKRGRPRKNRQ